jgi:hypothetical protein
MKFIKFLLGFWFQVKTRKVVYKVGETTWSLQQGVVYVQWKVEFGMLDFDIPNSGHKSNCVTYPNRTEAFRGIEKLCKDKGVRGELFTTPGGYRLFITSRQVKCTELHTWNKCDPFYIEFCNFNRQFACRVSPKIGRDNDYVAKHVATLNPKIEADPVLDGYFKAIKNLKKSDFFVKDLFK